MRSFILFGLIVLFIQACSARYVQQEHYQHHHEYSQQNAEHGEHGFHGEHGLHGAHGEYGIHHKGSFEQLNSNNPFYKTVADNFIQHSIQYFNAVYQILEQVINELNKENPATLPDNVVEDIENLKHIDCNLHCVLNDVKNQTIPRVVQSYGILNYLQATANKNSQVWKLLQQYKLEDTIQQYRNDINEYFDKFVQEFQNYMTTLDDNELEYHQELLAWFDDFSKTTDKSTRLYKFLEFFFYWDNFDFTKFWNL